MLSFVLFNNLFLIISRFSILTSVPCYSGCRDSPGIYYMKRLLGVVLVLVVACVPMNIHAQEVVDSFEYTGQKIEVENAEKYFTQSWELLDEAPIYCGTYIAWTSD